MQHVLTLGKRLTLATDHLFNLEWLATQRDRFVNLDRSTHIYLIASLWISLTALHDGIFATLGLFILLLLPYLLGRQMLHVLNGHRDDTADNAMWQTVYSAIELPKTHAPQFTDHMRLAMNVLHAHREHMNQCGILLRNAFYRNYQSHASEIHARILFSVGVPVSQAELRGESCALKRLGEFHYELRQLWKPVEGKSIRSAQAQFDQFLNAMDQLPIVFSQTRRVNFAQANAARE